MARNFVENADGTITTMQDVEGVEVPMNYDLPEGTPRWEVPADPWFDPEAPVEPSPF